MASTDGAPLWMTVALGVVPIVGALIAGTFALANTRSRRVERLKNLVEIEQKIPSWINHDQSLERLMIQELKGIELVSSPLLKWYRRFAVTFIGVYLVLFGSTMLPGIYGTATAKWLTWIAVASLLLVALVNRIFGERRRALNNPHQIRLEVLDIIKSERSKAAQQNTSEVDVEPKAVND
ncbi:hypothetical protein [Mycolicibacterium neoaurum]|uniref:Transmembrane protein n=1 Tax=Mycolicibacterium neoaurum TaxID=1795 RepID=A0AAV2WGJ2_MYCNE|nr:hypothetical protein [Mycolicibacterium neoaurum]TLH50352.1 hypothetical protein C1S81_20240 [Mycolicibacterium neoaurum]CDQ43188.1 hypothetical protein BN1047_01051 [Mycolicibacterium neoaurum]